MANPGSGNSDGGRAINERRGYRIDEGVTLASDDPRAEVGYFPNQHVNEATTIEEPSPTF